MTEARWWHEPAPEKPSPAKLAGAPKSNPYGAPALFLAILGIIIPVPIVVVGSLVTALIFSIIGLDYSHRKGAPGGMVTAAMIVTLLGMCIGFYALTL